MNEQMCSVVSKQVFNIIPRVAVVGSDVLPDRGSSFATDNGDGTRRSKHLGQKCITRFPPIEGDVRGGCVGKSSVCWVSSILGSERSTRASLFIHTRDSPHHTEQSGGRREDVLLQGRLQSPLLPSLSVMVTGGEKRMGKKMWLLRHAPLICTVGLIAAGFMVGIINNGIGFSVYCWRVIG